MSPSATLTPSPRPPAALGVLALHGVLLVLVLQTDVLQRVLPEVAPVHVTLLAAPAVAPAPSTAAPLPSAKRPEAPPLPFLPPPLVELRAVPVSPAAVPAPSPAPLTAQVTESAPQPAVPAPAAPAPPPVAVPVAEPRQLPPGAISYRVPPAIAVPLASRRLRESGTVWLRVRVDRQGLPVQVGVHRSSGFPRLDEQALAAMQAARFVPQTENGAAIEWVVIAPLAYDVD